MRKLSIASEDVDEDNYENDDVFEKKIKIDNNIRNMRQFRSHLPNNSSSFKPCRGSHTINLINCCSINYFLLSLWVSSQFIPKYSYEIDIRKKNESLYIHLIEIIKFLDLNDWARAQYKWVNDCLNINGLIKDFGNKKNIEIDCYGTVYAFFLQKMFSLQEYYLELENCNCNIKSQKQEPKSSFEINLTIVANLNNKFFRLPCDDCETYLTQKIRFKNSPLWLVVEAPACDLNEEIDIRSLPNYLNFDENNKFNLLCIYIHIKANHNNKLKLDHFRGIFYLDSKYFLVDDIYPNKCDILEDYNHFVSCLIYYKS